MSSNNNLSGHFPKEINFPPANVDLVADKEVNNSNKNYLNAENDPDLRDDALSKEDKKLTSDGKIIPVDDVIAVNLKLDSFANGKESVACSSVNAIGQSAVENQRPKDFSDRGSNAPRGDDVENDVKANSQDNDEDALLSLQNITTEMSETQIRPGKQNSRFRRKEKSPLHAEKAECNNKNTVESTDNMSKLEVLLLSDTNPAMADDAKIPAPPLSKLAERPSIDTLDSMIPKKTQVGFRNVQVGITSVDAKGKFLLFGTNAGCGFLYNRETGDLLKMLCEDRNDVVKTVKLLTGIECQCALGTTAGKVLITIISYGAAPNTRKVQKYALGSIHSSEITCLEWSTNGMKLFSGDKTGNVRVTERDFEKNECYVSSVLKEENAIVDLSYKHKVLLISTTDRTMLFNPNLTENQSIVIGSKARQGVFGACFDPNSIMTSELVIYCARPGFRIWVANIDGKVTKTILFKDLISSPHSEIMLTDSNEVIHKDNQFRRLVYFQEKYLLAFSGKIYL